MGSLRGGGGLSFIETDIGLESFRFYQAKDWSKSLIFLLKISQKCHFPFFFSNYEHFSVENTKKINAICSKMSKKVIFVIFEQKITFLLIFWRAAIFAIFGTC